MKKTTIVIIALVIIAALVTIFSGCDTTTTNSINVPTGSFNPNGETITEEIITESIIVEDTIIGSKSKVQILVEQKNDALKRNDSSEVQRLMNEIIKAQDSNFSKTYVIRESDRELLAKLVFCEASICSQECKRDIVSVVFNMLYAGYWGDSIKDVVYYENAFSPVLEGKLETATPDESCYEAVDYVIAHGPTLPTYVRYFRTDHDFYYSNYEYRGYKNIDNVYFGYFVDWQKGVH